MNIGSINVVRLEISKDQPKLAVISIDDDKFDTCLRKNTVIE